MLADDIPELIQIDWIQQSNLISPRSRIAHKGDCGHVVILGGAPGYSGAARLAGEAALRTGAGLVTIATHPEHAAWLNLTRPELMVHGIAQVQDLDPILERADVIAIGPGLGRGAWGRALWENLFKNEMKQALIIDADGLNLLAESPFIYPNWILTPHPGEAARLLRINISEVQQDKRCAVIELQKKYGGTVVLKGAGTLIYSNEDQVPSICSEGNPGLATAGSGDVLTGIIAALRGQGLTAQNAAKIGVCLHAAAGDFAARDGERGLLASDLFIFIRQLINKIKF